MMFDFIMNSIPLKISISEEDPQLYDIWWNGNYENKFQLNKIDLQRLGLEIFKIGDPEISATPYLDYYFSKNLERVPLGAGLWSSHIIRELHIILDKALNKLSTLQQMAFAPKEEQQEIIAEIETYSFFILVALTGFDEERWEEAGKEISQEKPNV